MGFIDEKGLKRTLKAIDKQIQTSKVIPDWNASAGKNEYIKNKTHYFYHLNRLDTNKLTSDVFMTDDDIYVTYLNQGFFKLNKNDSTKVSFGGPEITIYHQFVNNTSTHLVYVDNTAGLFGYYSYHGIDIIGIKKLDEIYIPDSITRNTQLEELKTRMIELTYSELVSLRNDANLIPGMQYRITDYVTTTSQTDTQSAGHQFDVVVIALDESTISENAFAMIHEGDTYFTEAGANLSAWQIWYCIDNDTTRFAWASNDESIFIKCIDHSGRLPNEVINSIIKVTDVSGEDDTVNGFKILYDFMLSDGAELYFAEDGEIYNEAGYECGSYYIVNGKGVIYRMIDEWNNDCPYDFKNIQFKRGIYADGNGIAKEEGDEDYYVFCYTFSWETEDDTIIMDTSIFGNNGYLINDEDGIVGVHDNTIKLYIDYMGDIETPSTARQFLNNIVFLDTFGYDGGLFYGCCGNSFGINCHDYNFGNRCWSNSFDNNCHNNSFGNDCYDNSFGNNCYSNIFGNDCYHNSFGDEFIHNSFGDEFIHNSFRNFCHHNNFDGNSCSYNSFGNNCNYNSFGNSCNYNSFGNSCHHISFGNYCDSNSFGNGCYLINFGTSKDSPKSYYRNIIVDSGNTNINLNCTETTSSSNYYQNVRIGLGVNNTTPDKTIDDSNVGQTYETKVAKNSSGEIKIYCEADLIA